MIQAYTIGVSMFLETNIGSALPGVIAAFETLNKVAKETQANVAGLGAALRGVARAESGIRGLAMTMERLNSAQRNAADSAARLNSAVTSVPAGGAAGAIAAATAAVNAAGRGGGGSGGGRGGSLAIIPNAPLAPNGIPLNPGFNQPAERPSNGELMQAGIGFGMIGAAITELIGSSVKATAEIQHLQSGLLSMGFTSAQSAQALNESFRLQQEVPGMSVGGGMHIIADMMTVLMKPNEALDPKALTGLAQMGVVLGQAGKGDAMAELFKAMQAGELRGALSNEQGDMDVPKFMAFLRNVQNTTNVTHGRVGPAEILQFLKSGGMGAASLSDPALFADSIMPILSMGAAKAGTALQGFAMQFSTGKMSDAAVGMLSNMGLFPEGLGKAILSGEATKVGIGQWRLNPSILPDSEQRRDRPEEWIQKTLLPRIDAYDLKNNGPPRDAADRMAQRMATGAALASRIPGGNFIGDIIRNYALVERDREGIRAGEGRDYFAQREATDPQVQFKSLSAAVNALQISLGGPIMDSVISGVNRITEVLNTLSSWANAHPETAGDIMKIVGTLGALSLAAGAASLTFALGSPMIKTLQWLGSAQAAAAAGNITGIGAALVSLAGIAAAFALTYAAGTALKSGLDAVGHYAEDAIYGAKNPNVAVARAARAAVENFDWRDRSTWADPNESWWNMRPKMPVQNTPIQLQGNVNLDGRRVGSFVATELASQVGRAPSGQTGFDPRMTPSPTGATP
jgi:hypothetical protein